MKLITPIIIALIITSCGGSGPVSRGSLKTQVAKARAVLCLPGVECVEGFEIVDNGGQK